MKVTYLFNSGFIIELENHILVFDYYKGQIEPLSPNKKVYIFASHDHRDHFNPEIYNIDHPNITYILSNDINAKGHHLAPHQSIKLDDIQVNTLISTDKGVAFIVHCENKNIFHSGDLNWWDWEGEPKDFLEYQEKTFKQEIQSIKDIKFDIMMVPLDTRLEDNAYKAIDYIEKNLITKYIIPMHSFNQHKKMSKLVDEPPLNQYSNILKIDKRNQVFNL